MEIDVKGIEIAEFSGEEAWSVAEARGGQSCGFEGEMIGGSEGFGCYGHWVVILCGWMLLLWDFRGWLKSWKFRGGFYVISHRYR